MLLPSSIYFIRRILTLLALHLPAGNIHRIRYREASISHVEMRTKTWDDLFSSVSTGTLLHRCATSTWCPWDKATFSTGGLKHCQTPVACVTPISSPDGYLIKFIVSRNDSVYQGPPRSALLMNLLASRINNSLALSYNSNSPFNDTFVPRTAISRQELIVQQSSIHKPFEENKKHNYFYQTSSNE
jgi:hypothetical protein